MITEDFQGKTVDGFVLKKVIGGGSFSTVYLAKDNQIADTKNNNKSHYFACKIMHFKQTITKHKSSRFNREIKIHRLMHHPNVLQLIDIYQNSKYYYIFLEYCSNGDLFNYIYNNGKLTENEASFFMKQILTGLKYIHSLNVAHRDIKPENILLDSNYTVKICDFGSSKLINKKKNRLTKTPYGSPSYSSPESLSGNPYDAQKSDIWACGVILYEMATGLSPWIENGQEKLSGQIKKAKFCIPQNVSENCGDLIRKLMTVDCNKRITIEQALVHPFLKDVENP